MKLSDQPYCSLQSLKQLFLLIEEVSSGEGIMPAQGQKPFNDTGDTDAKPNPQAMERAGDASVSTTGLSQENLGEPAGAGQTAGDRFHRRSHQTVSGKEKRRRPSS